MMRMVLIACFCAGAAQAEIKTVAEVEAVAPTCDTCQARKNAKAAYRAFLAEQRAEKEADAKDDD